jgi:hypothetical protein
MNTDTANWRPVGVGAEPAAGQRVVVLVKPDDDMDCDMWPAKWDAEIGAFSAGYGWFTPDEVTHWMPLPAAPMPAPQEKE